MWLEAIYESLCLGHLRMGQFCRWDSESVLWGDVNVGLVSVQARRRALGNIQFIGQLYKKKMLTEKIMHSCLTQLLSEVSLWYIDQLCRCCKHVSFFLLLLLKFHRLGKYLLDLSMPFFCRRITQGERT